MFHFGFTLGIQKLLYFGNVLCDTQNGFPLPSQRRELFCNLFAVFLQASFFLRRFHSAQLQAQGVALFLQRRNPGGQPLLK